MGRSRVGQARPGGIRQVRLGLPPLRGRPGVSRGDRAAGKGKPRGARHTPDLAGRPTGCLTDSRGRRRREKTVSSFRFRVSGKPKSKGWSRKIPPSFADHRPLTTEFPYSRNPKPETRNPKPETRNPKPPCLPTH